MAKQQLVLAYYGSEEEAEKAVESLKQWGKASGEIELDAIGILTRDDKGQVKTHTVGKRNTGIGAILSVIAAVISGGITLLGAFAAFIAGSLTIVRGIVGGSIRGALFPKGLGIPRADIAKIDGHLNDGKAAVGILVKPEKMAAVTSKMAELGGMAPESFAVSDEAVAMAVAATEARTDPEEVSWPDAGTAE